MAFARHKAQWRAIALSTPAVLFVGLLVVGPFVMLLAHSVWTQDYLDIRREFTWINYQNALSDPLVQLLLSRSLWVASLVALVTVVLAYPIALFIAFRAKRKSLWLILVTVPFWTSYLLRVFAWKLILGYNGVLNSGLQGLGLIEEPLSFILYNQSAVILTLSHAWAPFAILPIYVSLQKIDRSLLEAASDLGCTRWQRFLRVTLPLSIPGVLAAWLIIFIPTIGDYVTPSLVGGTDGKMIANLVQVMFGRANDWPFGSTLALLSLAMVGIAALTVALGTRRAVRGIK